MNQELSHVQAGFTKGRGFRAQIANICWIIEKAKEFRNTSAPASLAIPMPLTAWITTNRGKFLNRLEYQTTWPASLEICMQVKKQQLKPDREQQTGSKFKGVCQGCILYFTYLTGLQSLSYKMPGWMKHKLESRLLGEISITSDIHMIPPLW